MSRQQEDPVQILRRLRSGDRQALSRAITLVESEAERDRTIARSILGHVSTRTERTFRVGVTGVPGAGKSTFINVLGKKFTAQQKELAVLAIDPSSSRSKGSILGDKTRMEELSIDPLAFIRPTPTGGTLGGVASRTHGTIALCEAAGMELIMIETVGVGQSELMVDELTDMTILLVLAGAGDELQGIKRGIMESADLVVINKVDDPSSAPVKAMLRDLQNAITLLPPRHHGERPAVLTCSAINDQGIDAVKERIEEMEQRLWASGILQQRRDRQNERWKQQIAHDLLLDRFDDSNAARSALAALGDPYSVAQRAVDHFLRSDSSTEN